MSGASEHPAIVIGGGGHAAVLIDALLCRGRQVIGIVDIDTTRTGVRVLGVEVIGDESALEAAAGREIVLINGIGSTTSMDSRVDVYRRHRDRGWRFGGVIHPGAVISAHASLADDIQIMAGAVVQPRTTIGFNCILNTRSSIDHDCTIGNHVHVAPGATLCGGVTVQDRTHIGTGAIVLQGVRVGSACLIAAGAVVTRDVEDGMVVRRG